MIMKKIQTHLWEGLFNSLTPSRYLSFKIGEGIWTSNQTLDKNNNYIFKELEDSINVSIYKNSDDEIPIETPFDDNNWVLLNNDKWDFQPSDINKYFDTDNNQIVIYLKIEPLEASATIGEIGLFLNDTTLQDPIMVSHNLIEKHTISQNEVKIIKYTINI